MVTSENVKAMCKNIINWWMDMGSLYVLLEYPDHGSDLHAQAELSGFTITNNVVSERDVVRITGPELDDLIDYLDWLENGSSEN